MTKPQECLHRARNCAHDRECFGGVCRSARAQECGRPAGHKLANYSQQRRRVASKPPSSTRAPEEVAHVPKPLAHAAI